MKYKYGVKDPKEETPESLLAFLEKNKFPTEPVYILSDSDSYFKLFRDSILLKNFLSHMIFDSRGVQLCRDTTRCQWSGYDVVKTLKPDSAYRLSGGVRLEDILKHIRPVGRAAIYDTLAVRCDFTLIVTWAKFIGKYNYRLFDLNQAVRENKTARIRVIWLNIDVQKNWHLKKEQRGHYL
jgi:hypothetical protein